MNDGHPSNITGIAFMAAGVGFLVVMDGVAKWLVGADYSPVQILALRGWIIVAMMLAWLPRGGGLAALRSRRWKGLLLRVALGFCAPFFFFSALGELPLADVTVIFFGATFIMTALSVPLFKEHVGVHRWGAILVGFVGVLVAARPGGGVFQAGALFALAACVSYAFLILATRWLSRTESTFMLVFTYNLGLAAGYSLFLALVWRPMPVLDLGIVGVMAVLAMCGQSCMVRAFTLAPIGVVAPFEYTAIVWAAAVGFIGWGDVPSSHTLTGAAIIVTSGLYLVHRERRARKG